MSDFLSQLNWRFATKKFDSSKQIPPEALEKIKKAIQMAPSSFGLQPFHVVVVSDPNTREKLRAASYEQAQVTDASLLLVFCARADINDRIDSYIDIASSGKPDTLAQQNELIKSSFQSHDNHSLNLWASRQTYIALGFALAACAELEIDSCPMEGFNSKMVDEILDLPSYVYSVAYLAIGYRKDDEPQPEKIRFPESELFSEI